MGVMFKSSSALFTVLHSVSCVLFNESSFCVVKESEGEEEKKGEEEEEWLEITATGRNGWSIQSGGGKGMCKRWRETGGEWKGRAERGQGRRVDMNKPEN